MAGWRLTMSDWLVWRNVRRISGPNGGYCTGNNEAAWMMMGIRYLT